MTALTTPIDILLASKANGWCAQPGMEMRLSKLGVPENGLPVMAKEAHAIRRLLDWNPRDMSEAEILALYRSAL